jgi:hypothetical protein
MCHRQSLAFQIRKRGGGHSPPAWPEWQCLVSRLNVCTKTYYLSRDFYTCVGAAHESVLLG